MKKYCVIFFALLFISLSVACSEGNKNLNDEEALAKIDIKSVPEKIYISVYSPELSNDGQSIILEKSEDIYEVWKILQTKEWKESHVQKKSVEEMEMATPLEGVSVSYSLGKSYGYELSIINNHGEVSMEFPGTKGSQPSDEFYSMVTKTYVTPKGIPEALREYVVERYKKETAHIAIDNPKIFVDEFFKSASINTAYYEGDWYGREYYFEYSDNPALSAQYIEALGDITKWEPAVPEYADGTSAPPRGAMFSNRETHIYFSVTDYGTSISINFKEKSFLFHSKENIPAVVEPITVQYFNEHVTLDNPSNTVAGYLGGLNITVSSADASFEYGSVDGIYGFLSRDYGTIVKEGITWEPIASSDFPAASKYDVKFERKYKGEYVVFRKGGEYVYILIHEEKDFYYRIPSAVSFENGWLNQLKIMYDHIDTKHPERELEVQALDNPPTDVISALNEMLVQYEKELN